jgi:predicted nucleotidyltransferase
MSELNMRSFLPHDELSKKIWEDDENMRPDVQKALENIANEFLDYLKIDVDVEDVTFTGSYANYNYTPYSDIDLHIVIDFDKISNDEDLVEGFMNAKKSYWNDRYDITVNGIEVEIYPQDSSEEHVSSGVYSIDQEKWIVKPEKFQKEPNLKSANKKFQMLKREISSAIESEDLKSVERLLKKLRNMRKSALNKSGEMSVENIAYKMLRSEDLIQKLYDSKFSLYGDSISL